MCRVTISRFYRDREVFRFIEREVLVKLSEAAMARGESELRCRSIGCASGEEPYTLAILWDLGAGRKFQALKLTVLATDADRGMIGRAEEGCYSASSLRDLPRTWQVIAFERQGGRYCIKSELRDKVTFLTQDIRTNAPESPFHLLLCRNLAFTYFDPSLQQDILSRLKEKLVPGGALVIGAHEALPSGAGGFAAWPRSTCVYWKRD
jgi:chemotaxis protein methyltransferase CheR